MNRKTKNIILHDDQQEVFNAITESIENIIKTDMVWDNMLSLSGAAGTGKTFLTAEIVKYFVDKKYSVAVTTPTHRALKIIRDSLGINIPINFSTIHSFLNIKLFTDYSKGIQKFIVDKSSTNTSRVDLLIVDESSMVSKELYNYIVDAIEAGRAKSVLFVGDKYQLLPIDDNEQIFDRINHNYELTKIVRQAEGSYIIKIATQAREIIKSQNYMLIKEFFNTHFDSNIEFFHDSESFYSDFYKNENWSNEDKVIASFKNSDVDAHNRHIRKEYWRGKGYEGSIETLMTGDSLVLQDTYTKDDMVVFNNGAEITLSYTKKEYMEAIDIYFWECKDINGTALKVVDIDSQLRFNNVQKKIAENAKKEKNYHKRKELWKLFFDLKNLFANVKYKFASTIHKLQGSTFETVYIDLFNLNSLERTNKDDLFRLIYVAMTRASMDIKILVPSLNLQGEVQQINSSVRKLFDTRLLQDFNF